MALKHLKKLRIFMLISVIMHCLETAPALQSYIQLNIIEKSLLRTLGLKSRPAPNDHNSTALVPKAILELYLMQNNLEYESTSLPLPGKFTGIANTVRSFTHRETEIDRKFAGKSYRFRLFFDFIAFPVKERVISAELKLHVLSPSANECNILERVNVYDIIRPGIKGQTKPILRLVDTRVVNPSRDQNISVDVLPIIHRWVPGGSINHGILIEVKPILSATAAASACILRTPRTRLRRSPEEGEEWGHIQPLLLVYSADSAVLQATRPHIMQDTETYSGKSPSTRSKRSANISRTKSKRRARLMCSRQSMWVDFEKVGWNDWIVAPPGYEAFYCAGDCPTSIPDHLNTTNHAIVQTLVHTVHPTSIPKSCCVPTSLSPISMLYLDENNKAVLKNYPDMVVDGCGCR